MEMGGQLVDIMALLVDIMGFWWEEVVVWGQYSRVLIVADRWRSLGVLSGVQGIMFISVSVSDQLIFFWYIGVSVYQ